MVFVPLPLFATFILVGAVIMLLVTRNVAHRTNQLFVLLIALYALQSFMLCLRWGYGLDQVGVLIAFLAPVLPVCAYLAYLSLIERPKAIWAGVSATIAMNWIVLFAARDLADVTILLTYIGFGTVLILRARKGSDVMVLAKMTRAEHAVTAMMLTGFALIASGMVDIFVLVDFIRTGGQNVGLSITLAQSGFLLCVGAAALVGQLGATEAPQESTEGRETHAEQADADVLARIRELFAKQALHHDTELNLRRIARRLGVPDRTVSRAINRLEQQSVSQFVNTFRIEDACQMLKQSDQSILQASLAAGFLTKSNFNREFLRVTGQTPSQWRKLNV